MFEFLSIDGFGHCEMVTNLGSTRTVSVDCQFPNNASKHGTKDTLDLNLVRLNVDISCLDHATRS
jgi:hypothetical protein